MIGLPISAYAIGSYDAGTSLVYSDMAGAYSIAALVSADLGASYAIEGGTTLVSADLAGAFSVAALVSADLAAAYGIAIFVSADLAGSYAVDSTFTYARAPAGSGYAPQRTTSVVRPSFTDASRPASTQRNTR